MKFKKNIWGDLIGKIGKLEMFFALCPILQGFNLGGFPLSLIVWILMLLVIFVRGYKIRLDTYKPLLMLAIYWLLHTIVVALQDNVNTNAMIAQVIYFLAIFSVYPLLNKEKLRRALNIVCIIVMAGLLYQWMEIMITGGTHPLEIIGLQMSKERLETLSVRPSSFFMEPAAYAEFMLLPIALALMDKRIIWAIILILSVFFTSSTTGIVTCFLMLGAWTFMQKKRKALIVIPLIAIGLIYALNHFSVFEVGVDKLNNTDVETNVRLTQGEYVVGTMEGAEYIFGVPYSSAYNYCKSGRATNVIYYGEAVYMPTFWNLILLYGLVGLFLYLMTLFNLLKMCKQLFPLITSLIITMYSGGMGLTSSFVYCMIFMLVVGTDYSKNQICSKKNI